MSDDDNAALRATVSVMRERMDQRDVFLAENQSFHAMITDSTGNVVLRAFTGTLKSVLDGAVEGIEYTLGARVAVADAHERIVEAPEARDGERARQGMYDHLKDAATYWQDRGFVNGRGYPWAF